MVSLGVEGLSGFVKKDQLNWLPNHTGSQADGNGSAYGLLTKEALGRQIYIGQTLQFAVCSKNPPVLSLSANFDAVSKTEVGP